MKRPHEIRANVQYRTRGDRAISSGTVQGYVDTLRGMFVVVKDSHTALKHKVRPANVFG